VDRHRRGIVAVVFALVGALVAGAVVAELGSGTALIVEDAGGGELVSEGVEDGTVVSLEYTHSVEKTQVRDVYVVEDGRLVLERTVFESYGAGLPSEAEVERSDDGGFVFRPDGRSTDELVVSTGRVAGHELVVGGERHDLTNLSEAGTVRLRVEEGTDAG